jgi:hypothetical protein
MRRLVIDMKKTLKQLDPIYNSVTSYMSKKERIMYCESLIKETEEFVKKTTRPMDLKSKTRYEEIVEAARAEIEILTAKS